MGNSEEAVPAAQYSEDVTVSAAKDSSNNFSENGDKSDEIITESIHGYMYILCQQPNT